MHVNFSSLSTTRPMELMGMSLWRCLLDWQMTLKELLKLQNGYTKWSTGPMST
uniref:IDP2350 n=1 Tax=Arundo donax TaxID=35708 RepID=A0A0A9EUS2_ARUDO